MTGRHQEDSPGADSIVWERDLEVQIGAGVARPTMEAFARAIQALVETG